MKIVLLMMYVLNGKNIYVNQVIPYNTIDRCKQDVVKLKQYNKILDIENTKFQCEIREVR
jgi:hypothetical protein